MVDAQKVYSIVGKGLYPSAFPEYSAKIGNKPFERISLYEDNYFYSNI